MAKKYLIFIFICGMIVSQNAIGNRLLLESDWTAKEYHKYKTCLEELRKSKKIAEIFQAGDTTNSYDVISYNIYMDWYNILHYGEDITPEDKYWDANVQIVVKSNIDGLNVISLDAVDLEIRGVWINKAPATIDLQVVNNIISIPLDFSCNKGDEILIDIDYRYNKFDNIGFNLYYKNMMADGRKTEENIAYTVNSPEFARYWFPCNDTPRDKAALTMRIKVPFNYKVASNGMLIAKEDVILETGGDYSTFVWHDTTPIATFLINAVASKFEEYTEWFSPNPNDSDPDSLEIINFVWKNDLAGNVYSAERALRRTKNMLEYFSTLFIDYPFCKYGTAEVHPFIYSAMENQTMTSLSKTIYQVTSDDNTIAHEIAHHWFGDLVSSYTWDDIWFKEGGATWCEALWQYKRMGENESAYFGVMRDKARAYISYPDIYNVPIWGNSPDIFFSIPYVFLTYQKASWIYHQLHYHIGYEKNLSILRKILTKYAYRNIDDKLFVQTYKDELAGYPLDFDIGRFFDQWLYGAGHPIYDCQTVRILESETTDTTWSVNVTLTQTQAGSKIAEVFETPIWIMFFRGNQVVYEERVINNQKIQEYNFSNIPNFTTCRIDSARTLTQTSTSSMTSIKHTDIGEVFVYPNPAVSQKFIYIAGTENVEYPFMDDIISVTNSFGMTQSCLITKLDNSIQIDISDFVTGIYFIRYNGNFLKFNVIK